MTQALLLLRGEQLLVFTADPADDRIGPYQELAPPLLELPEDEVQWLAEFPTLRTVIEVPGALIRALVEGRHEDATELLSQAVKEDSQRRECLDPRPHGPHEWFNMIATHRRECQGRRHHRLRPEPPPRSS